MRKMDEMEMAIALKSIRWAWLYTVVFLFIWTIYDFIKSGSIGNSPVFFLLITQNLILIFSQQFLKRKMSQDEE